MLPFTFPYFIFLHYLLLITVTTAATPPYNPTDYIQLNCGSTSTENFNNRSWKPDSGSKFLPQNFVDISSTAEPSEGNPSVDRIPYMTARIFHSDFTYTFPVTPGPKFIRLYFYPATYSGLNKTESFFTVTANQYTLLRNFSAFLTVSAQKTASIVEEFIVNVGENQILNVTFSPSSKSYSFVNGIEIVSMPFDLYLKDKSQKSVDQQGVFDFNKNITAFQTMYRLNVGGGNVDANDDTGMFRKWLPDDAFLPGYKANSIYNNTIVIRYTTETPPYTAPEIVYYTARAMGQYADKFRLTWNFPVDSGFLYLFRLHFCEMQPNIVNDQNQRIFTILINNKTAEHGFDVFYHTNGNGIPIFRDYVIEVPHPSDGRRSKQDLWLVLFPNMESKPVFADAILNGLEIFKLNNSVGNLAAPNPELLEIPNSSPQTDLRGPGKTSSSRGKVYAIVGGVVGASFVVVLIIILLIFRRRRRLKDLEKSSSKSSWAPFSISSKSTKTNGSSSLPSDLCRNFLLQEIKSATADFNDSFIIGRGGFGNVYKGYIDNGATAVAIKRLNPSSSQGAHEFTTEIEMLSKLRHLHLVSLIGYCDEQGEMILVYEYMSNGTLRDHLYKTENSPLTWKQRLQIVIGAAKGLHYLHMGVKQNIIHRDVKSTNILLDEKLVAKVSDFGLSKIGPTGGIDSHVSTVVKGSFGYVDPEYYKKQQLTDKSDVYSFGVVLIEVLCARPVIIPNIPKEQVNLAEWARRNYKKGSIDEIIDPNLKNEIAHECLRSYAEIAFNCLKDRGIERPTMNDVVGSLEFALDLQQAAEKNGSLDNPSHYPLLFCGGEVTTTDDELFSGSGEYAAKSNSSATTTSGSDRLRSETVFSEIGNPIAR